MHLRLEKNLSNISPADPPYLQHIKSGSDLVTPYPAIRAGFVAMALEKNRRATPFVAQARALKVAAATVATPNQLVNLADIRLAVLTAAGISDKALVHLQEEDKTAAIEELIQNFLIPAGQDWVDELVYRFLLTRGDTLGGEMRNVAGALAQRKLTRAIISALTISGASYRWYSNKARTWLEKPDDDIDIENDLSRLSWVKAAQRTLVYNLTVPVVNKNVDLCLFDCSPEDLRNTEAAREVYKSPNKYIALGELKGGIDPAGADEHWKTAHAALHRIRQGFGRASFTPRTFFIAAAIEKRMADEIWQQLNDGTMTNAANLTDDNQVASLSRWLCDL